MLIEEFSSQNWKLTNPGGNYSNNGYPARAPQILNPTLTALTTGLQKLGDGVINIGHGGIDGPKYIDLVPIGTGSATNTFSIEVIGWTATNLGTQVLWIPVGPIIAYAVTLGSAAGVANSDLGSTTLFGKTITSTLGPTFITSGAAPISNDWFQISPATSAGIAMIRQRTFGFRYLEFIFTTGGSATDCNALWKAA